MFIQNSSVIKSKIEFAKNSGADSYSFAILNPLPGTPIYRKVVKENLWWENRSMNDMLYRSSLVKVNGFSGPEEFEKFVNESNVKVNLLLRERNLERFKYKYGSKSEEHLRRQT